MAVEPPLIRDSIRTYVRRSGRMGPELLGVLDERLPAYAAGDGPWRRDTLFPQVREWAIEIGTGMGEATLEMASREPDVGIVGIDVHAAGIGSLVRGAHRLGLTNVRAHLGDAVVALHDCVPPASVDQVRVWFPDPWPKTRHHKRRLIQPDTVALLASRLRNGGTLHVATDVDDYADAIADVMATTPTLRPLLVRGPRPPWRPWTKFERAGLREGRPAQDFIYQRT